MQRLTVPQLLFLADAPPLSLSLSGADPGWHAVLGATHKVAPILMLGALQSLQMPHVENWMPWQSSHAVRLAVTPLPRGQVLQRPRPRSARNCPAGHGMQVLLPLVLATDPASHGKQWLCEVLLA